MRNKPQKHNRKEEEKMKGNKIKRIVLTNDYEQKEIDDIMLINECDEEDAINAYYDFMLDDLNELRKCGFKEKMRILCVADLGLWSGRHCAYKIFDNFGDIFYTECDIFTWFIDRYNNFRFVGAHHDGYNHYLYRIIPENVSDEVIERMENVLYEGKNADYYIRKYTLSLGKWYLENGEWI